MMDLQITMKETSDLTEKDMKSLIGLKQQHWGYTDEEQRNWFNENIKVDDYHLMIYWGGGYF